MTPETFLHRLRDRGLWLDVSPETGKLAIYGDAEQLHERICEYIRSHRDALIALLQAKETTQPVKESTDQVEETALDTSPIANEATNLDAVAIGDIRLIPCYMSTYGLCSNQVVEQDDPEQEGCSWRISPDGLIFCVSCWQARNIEQADLAIPYLADHGQPTDLETRIERVMSGPGYGCCGGHDWVVDWTGILVCHHVIEGAERHEGEQPHEIVAARRSPAQAA